MASRGLTYEQFEMGAVYPSQARTVTEADVANFAGLSGDFNPLHTDAEFAKTTPMGERIAHGVLILAMATGMANWMGIFEGTTLALMEQVTRYKGAVKFGDTIRLEMEVIEKKPTSKPEKGVVKFAVRVKNQRDENVVEGEWTLLMKAVSQT
ncbi:MAG: MaoC family dehydratase N-terminal domain-containing protein [Anaerolineae bacterium]|nr:MaoC family dehydratase N-terminal domain-containing protein [Anaerolineae bacterium]MBL8104569.1 MaoC family dehydratase N-terminal domain-containing protein [Anaerolineales bacterium]